MPTSPSGSPRRQASIRVNDGAVPLEAYQRWPPIQAVSSSSLVGLRVVPKWSSATVVLGL
jgi:hypothetical protein